MKTLNAYLNFDGNTREAMTFYAKCLGAEVSMQSFSDAPMPVPPGSEKRVIHARLSKGSAVLMASDTMPGMPFTQGNNVHIMVDCESDGEVDKLAAAIGEGGKVTMPVDNMFWGARFGMVTDKFGVSWMFNHEHPKKP